MYCVQADIETLYGAVNVAAWADADNVGNPTVTAERIARAIEVAGASINAALRMGLYTLPLSAPYDVVLVDLCARLAGVWLYESRGIQDFDAATGTPYHKLTWHKTDAERTLDLIRRGSLRLDADIAQDFPEVVELELATPTLPSTTEVE